MPGYPLDHGGQDEAVLGRGRGPRVADRVGTGARDRVAVLFGVLLAQVKDFAPQVLLAVGRWYSIRYLCDFFCVSLKSVGV